MNDLVFESNAESENASLQKFIATLMFLYRLVAEGGRGSEWLTGITFNQRETVC